MKIFIYTILGIGAGVFFVLGIFFALPVVLGGNYFYVPHPLRVQDDGMEPTVPKGSFWIVSPRTNRTVTLAPGTVVLAVIPKKNGGSILGVRRVIAPQAGIVESKKGILYSGGKKFNESFTNTPEIKKTFVPFASYFLLGDNRKTALDSTEVGAIKQDDIVSILKFCYWGCK